MNQIHQLLIYVWERLTYLTFFNNGKHVLLMSAIRYVVVGGEQSHHAIASKPS